MSVTVTTSTGTQQVDGADWHISERGDLTVTDAQGNDVETFVAGSWDSVSVTAPS